MIPTPDTVTSGWLTEQLRRGGHDTAEVVSFSMADVGTGQVGRCIRISMEMTAATAVDVPRSLVGKFTSDDPTSRETSKAMNTYVTETAFYKHIAPKVSIRVPRCYYADIDEEGLEHLILMEDMAPGKQGDQIGGCSPEVVREAVMQLVGLQVPTWQDKSWYDLLGRVEDGPFADMKGLYNRTMPGFVERYESAMDSRHIEFIKAIGAAGDCPMFNYDTEYSSLEHYDYRLDNVLINEGTSPPIVTAVDWQSIRVGKPLNDVAYFMGSAVEPEVRREIEQDILRDYHAALVAGGVSDFSMDDCFREYRKGIYAGFAVSVVAPVLVVRTERGDQMFTAMARRYAQMAIDLGADEFLV